MLESLKFALTILEPDFVSNQVWISPPLPGTSLYSTQSLQISGSPQKRSFSGTELQFRCLVTLHILLAKPPSK